MSLLDKLRRRGRQELTGGVPPAEGSRRIGESTESLVVDRYDVWAIAADLLDAVTTILREAAVEYVVLPAGTAPTATVVVPAAVGKQALAALQAARSTGGWSVLAHPRRDEPGDAQPLRSLVDTRGMRSLTLLPNLVTPDGFALSDPQACVELELWRRVTEVETARRDGGFFEPSTLLAARRNRAIEYLEPEAWRRAQQVPEHWPRPQLPHVFDVVEPIDLVYTWVDGSDPAWQRRKASAQRGLDQGTGHNPEAFVPARFADHDELRYSLRSVQANANWVNHIWLVTDDQTPGWLNTDHPKITIVDHREIFTDPGVLPVFNSHAIESQLHHIDGLAERYLYLNDDVFFGLAVRPELFFHGNGIAKLFPSTALLDAEEISERDVPVLTAAKRSRELIEREFGRTFSQKTQHVPLPQVKGVLQELEKRFPDRFAAVMRSKFRHPSDLAIPSSLALYWAYATGRAVVGSMAYGYLDLSASSTDGKFADWLQRRPFDCFCLNDSDSDPESSAERDLRVRAFLEAYYPVPSDYERVPPGGS